MAARDKPEKKKDLAYDKVYMDVETVSDEVIAPPPGLERPTQTPTPTPSPNPISQATQSKSQQIDNKTPANKLSVKFMVNDKSLMKKVYPKGFEHMSANPEYNPMDATFLLENIPWNILNKHVVAVTQTRDGVFLKKHQFWIDNVNKMLNSAMGIHEWTYFKGHGSIFHDNGKDYTIYLVFSLYFFSIYVAFLRKRKLLISN